MPSVHLLLGTGFLFCKLIDTEILEILTKTQKETKVSFLPLDGSGVYFLTSASIKSSCMATDSFMLNPLLHITTEGSMYITAQRIFP